LVFYHFSFIENNYFSSFLIIKYLINNYELIKENLNYELWGLGIGDWGFGFWGLGAGVGGLGPPPNPQSPIPNPQSPREIF